MKTQWTRPLWHFVKFPNKSPVCPAVCPFRLYCSDWVQRGISKNFIIRTLESHRECFFYIGLQALSQETFGREPETADEFMELATERAGMNMDPTS